MLILIADEKHNYRYFNASTITDLDLASRKLIDERWSMDYYTDDPKAQKEAQQCVNMVMTLDQLYENGSRAWRFLLSRTEYEYEHVCLEYLENTISIE